MSQISTRGYQIGIDAVTPANNFALTVPAVQDGTLRLQRGNAGSPTSDILTVNVDNTLNFNYPVANAYGNAGAATRRNKLDNTSYLVNQRVQGATTTASIWIADRWTTSHNLGTQVTFSTSNFSSNPGVPGFMGMKCNSVITPTSGQYAGIQQAIEAYALNDTRFGNSNALPMTFSFYAYATTIGTYSISLRNSGATRSYVINWTSTTLNAWVRYVFVIPPDTTGTWVTVGANTGLSIFVTGTAGSSFQAPAAFSWQTGNYITAPGATGMTTAINQEVDYSGFQLELGSAVTPYEYLPYAENLIQCQRYFELVEGTVGSTQPQYISYQYKVNKRASPVVSLFSGSVSGASFDNGNNSLTRLRCPGGVVATGATDWVIAATAEI